MGVKGDGTGAEQHEAGYHGDVMSQAAVTAATCAQRFAKAQKRHNERVKVKIYAHAENALTQFKEKYQH